MPEYSAGRLFDGNQPARRHVREKDEAPLPKTGTALEKLTSRYRTSHRPLKVPKTEYRHIRLISTGSALLQELHDPVAGLPVSVRIDRLTHGPVMLGVVEQRADAPDDSVIIGADQTDRSGVERLGTRSYRA